jgi:dipeptidyl aminopeptidase/acylaminoacyl peptidase
MPHGGPDARDDMLFDWWSQYLATRGYAVLRPNFRGSSGYGRAFTEAGLHQWGLKMQDDISDGVKKVIADGIADPKRVCIVGASYGGYAALAGATLTPELYACVVSYAGIGSLPDILGYDQAQGRSSIAGGSFNVTRIGDAFKDAARLDATSPVLHADKVRAPVLLMHSERDVTVPIAQSEGMEIALKKAGKRVEFIRLSGEDDHSFAGGVTTQPAQRNRTVSRSQYRQLAGAKFFNRPDKRARGVRGVPALRSTRSRSGARRDA